MAETLQPATAAHVVDAVRWAMAEQTPLELLSGGTKRGYGRPVQAAHSLDLSGLAGIELYEPEELVLRAGPGTPMAEIEAALAEAGQMLAFEPADLGPLYGHEAGCQTLGGAVAANLSGPRRIKAGAARDHLLGFEGVSGRGEAFKSGGRVVKNVTGYDLSKLMAGSLGTLAALTQVTVKVLPAPEAVRTVLVLGHDETRAVAAMTDALNSPHEVSAAAYLPAAVAARSSVAAMRQPGAAATALRVEGPAPSVAHRAKALHAMLGGEAATAELADAESRTLWREVRDVAPLLPDRDRLIWRLSVPPAAGAAVCRGLPGVGEAYLDWGGGLIWLALPASPDGLADAVRAAIAELGGHATLMRAPDDLRAAVPVFQPLAPPVAALSARLKAQFDPRGVLNPGRIAAGA